MEDSHSGQNRRKSERLDTAFTLIYRVEKPLILRIQMGFTNDIDALMLDLSDLGMAIITKHDLPTEAQLDIKLNIIDLRLSGDERRRHMEITGNVASNVTLADKSHRIGICFTKVSDEDKVAISGFIKRNMFPSQ